MKFKYRLSLTAILFSIIIAGCSTPPPAKKAVLSDAEKMQIQATKLLQQAKQADPAKAAQLQAQSAFIYLDLNQSEKALSILQQLNTSLLPSEQKFSITQLLVSFDLEQEQYAQVLQRLSTFLSENDKQLTLNQTIWAIEQRSDILKRTGEAFGSIQQLIQLSLLLNTEEDKQQLHNKIWQELIELDSNKLTDLLRSGTNSYYEQGWLELTNELRLNKQLDTQNQAIQNWAILWEAHPAKQLPPSNLAGFSDHTISAQTIGVLLPFSGKLQKPANAIKEGLLMAHFRSQVPGKKTPNLLFLDSNKINTPIQLATIIEQQQIDLIIGPLSKSYVTNLSNDSHIKTPILALNYSDDTSRNGLYQLGLSADDEARQIANRAWNDGIKKAAILTPSSNWGAKVANSFSDEFAQLGGETVSQTAFGETSEFSDDVSTFLGTDKSKKRFKKLRETVYIRKINFEEHRRQDIDAIVLTALPNDARQLSPILAFNFAGDLPIYATSHVYSGTPDPIQDQDLNNIRFVGTPWSLAPPSQDKVLMSQQKNDTNSRFGRLYALGLDAYLIYPYLQQLSSLPGAEISGQTGKISIDSEGIAKRRSVWAIYKDGIPLIIE